MMFHVLCLLYFSIHDQEEEVSGIICQYQDELKGLRNVVREKQRFIDQMTTDKQ